MRAAEAARLPGKTALTEAVARYYFKLLAIKDEYEVARLYTDGDFVKRVAAQFEGDYKLNFHLAPPLSNKPDPVTGEAKKSSLRAVDDDGIPRAGEDEMAARHRARRASARRRSGEHERRLITDYEALIDELLPRLAAHNHAIAVELALDPRAHSRLRPVEDRHLKVARGEGSQSWWRASAPRRPVRRRRSLRSRWRPDALTFLCACSAVPGTCRVALYRRAGACGVGPRFRNATAVRPLSARICRASSGVATVEAHRFDDLRARRAPARRSIRRACPGPSHRLSSRPTRTLPPIAADIDAIGSWLRPAPSTLHRYWSPNSRSAVRFMCATSSGCGPMPPRIPNTLWMKSGGLTTPRSKKCAAVYRCPMS